MIYFAVTNKRYKNIVNFDSRPAIFQTKERAEIEATAWTTEFDYRRQFTIKKINVTL